MDTKNILYFSYLAHLDLSVSQKDETWLHKIAIKYSNSKSFWYYLLLLPIYVKTKSNELFCIRYYNFCCTAAVSDKDILHREP